MAKTGALLVLIATAVGLASAQAPQWGQCGGQGWTGATTCVSGWTCTYSNPWYSQCLQGASTTSKPLTTSPISTSSGAGTTTDWPNGSPTPTTTKVSSTTTVATTTTTATGSSTTLQPGWSFIRAVEDPNFHKYLRSEIINTVSDAVLGEPSTAAQFQITNGQLIQNAGGTNLYAVVEPRANSTVNKLKVSWSATPATSGTFVFSGDTVEWSNPAITRPQNNAWLVCPDVAGNKLLYVNLGAYSYQTPAGCADETIHAYTGATATA